MSRFPIPERTLRPPVSNYTTPAETYYNHITRANCYEAEDAARFIADNPPVGKIVAIDIETRGLDKFFIRCVTGAWDAGNDTISVFLDPRHPPQREAVKLMIEAAGTIVLHNAPYDIPGLYQNYLMDLDDIDKVWDTLVLARMYNTDFKGGRDLDTLASKYADFPELSTKIEQSFAIMGHKPGVDEVTGEKFSGKDMAFRNSTPDDPIYRAGAMADTVATLRILPILWEMVRQQQVDFAAQLPSPGFTGSVTERINYLIEREQVTNRVMLRRSAIGILADLDYAEKYRQDFERSKEIKQSVFSDLGLNPTPGKITQDVIDYLHVLGKLPATWPKSEKTSVLSSSKKETKNLNSSLLRLATDLKEHDKILGYLDKIIAMANVTGRVHPEVGILGAHATGRMSYKYPELQQFPSSARPILHADPGREWTSIDWSSIEPVVLTNVAHDFDYLTDFNKGGDLYIPSAKIAGLIPHELSDEEAASHPGRKQAKTVVLANMYGQGKALLAKNLGVSIEEAEVIKNQYNSAMQPTVEYLARVRDFAGKHGFIRTIDGRGLTVPKNKPHPDRPWDTDPYTGYKAMNFIVQGTAYSMLSETINEIHRQGLEDAVIMAIHDELVVDSEATEDIQKIMLTPPEWLNDAAGRVVTLRSDANPMGNHWMYV